MAWRHGESSAAPDMAVAQHVLGQLGGRGACPIARDQPRGSGGATPAGGPKTPVPGVEKHGHSARGYYPPIRTVVFQNL